MRLDSKISAKTIGDLWRGHARFLAKLFLGFALAGSLVCAQQPAPRINEAAAERSAEGQQIFAANCAACHGLDGSGTHRAPNIGAGAKIQRLPSAEVLRIVSDG